MNGSKTSSAAAVAMEYNRKKRSFSTLNSIHIIMVITIVHYLANRMHEVANESKSDTYIIFLLLTQCPSM